MANISKLICFFLILFTLPNLQAQMDGLNGSGIYLSLGQMRNSRFQSASMASFLQSYNQRFAGDLVEKFDPLVLDNNFAWGIGAHLYTLDIEVMFSDMNYLHTATFRDGRVREISRESNQFITNVGLLFPTDLIKVGAFVTMSNSRGFVSSRMIYPDGSFSYGIESPYNGVFKVDQMDIGYGFKAMVGLKYAFLTFQAQRLGWNFREGGRDPIAMIDELGIAGDGKFYTNYTYPTFLGENAGEVPEIADAVLTKGLVNPALSNWRFFLGISFCLSSSSEL